MLDGFACVAPRFDDEVVPVWNVPGERESQTARDVIFKKGCAPTQEILGKYQRCLNAHPSPYLPPHLGPLSRI